LELFVWGVAVVARPDAVQQLAVQQDDWKLTRASTARLA
jgi:hypothetical protein